MNAQFAAREGDSSPAVLSKPAVLSNPAMLSNPAVLSRRVSFVKRPFASSQIVAWGMLACLMIAGCSTTRTGPTVRPTEPPPSYKAWDKLTWLENQLNSSNESDRPELLARMAELYLNVERPERASTTAREAIYAVGTGSDRANSITSRARAVLGAIAMVKDDRLAARRELDLAARIATNDSERGAAWTLLAMVEERDRNPGMANIYRQKVKNPGDAHIQELLQSLTENAPRVANPRQTPNPAPIANAPVVPNNSDGAPAMISRERWKPAKIGADTEAMGPILRITVHHEGKEFNGTSLDDTLRQVRNIQNYHQRGRKWADIGYHFIIDRLGNIVEGRDLKFQGAHAGERNKKGESPNTGNVGISLLGNYDIQKPTPAQTKALRDLVSWLRAKYKIRGDELYTHGEIKQKFKIDGTDCPGRNVRPLIEQMRRSGLASNDGGASVKAAAGRAADE